MPRIDPFFDKQPPLTFIDELRTPMYQSAPDGWGSRERKEDEVDASGVYIATPCFEPLLETSWASFARFAHIYKIEGTRYPVRITRIVTEHAESWRAEIMQGGVQISGDTEGIRRALVWLEDELRRAEAPYLVPGVTERHAVIRSRITRCFFSPINRPPKFGDELSDDIDYYPEEYLNRLMHDGSNGVWIYTRFSDLMESSFVENWGKGRESRVEKLCRVIDKCARYGIGVYVFAIEPMSMFAEDFAKCPEIAGVKYPIYESGYGYSEKHCICVECDEGRQFVYESGKRLFEAAPGLRGFISITYGERPTACSSMTHRKCPKGACPATCEGELLADNVAALRAGMKAAKPDCEVISWTYGHRTWEFDDIRDYVDRAPLDVMLMQNFDDMGYEEQLGVMRQCVDYWLSYVGPSDLFTITAEQAKKSGRHMFAKMQVCCSHEIASVPYVPVPGIIYKKYAGARDLGVEGVLQCWYFGNFPSMMSKAAGELSFVERFDDEKAFLTSLASIFWGRTNADKIAAAWGLFEEAYRMYPMNVMFSYYGPMHDSVVWKLALEPKNNKLPRTWQTLDPIDGDRIGESLLQGHTLDEALTLVSAMCEKWQAGLDILTAVPVTGGDMREQVSVAKAIGVLWDGTRNILEFYKLRHELGLSLGDAQAKLSRMEALVLAEIENSRAMIPLCVSDRRLGYHSEGEGYKFFPEKLLDRIAQLEELLVTEFPRVRARIDAGLAPLAYYLGETDEVHYAMAADIEDVAWEMIGDKAKFRASLDGLTLTLDLVSDTPTTFQLCPEFKLFTPDPVVHISPDGTVSCRSGIDAKLYNSLFGERYAAELAKYENSSAIDGGRRLTLDLADFGFTEPRPFKFRLAAGGVSWVKDPESLETLGLFGVRVGEYGWMMPPKK